MHRRAFLAAGGGALLAACETRPLTIATPAGAVMPSNQCKPIIRTTEGPYVLPTSPLRSDVREGRPGVPLTLRFQVVDLYTCQPMPNVKVEIWQSDANGLYSGVVNMEFDIVTLKATIEGRPDTRGQEFLRGHQVSDAEGYVIFNTIFPGWYSARLPHIHVRSFNDTPRGTMSHNTQLFMPAGIQNQVYQTDPYKARGANTIGLDRDLVLRGDSYLLRELTMPMNWNANTLEADMKLAAFRT
jgi:protocatechuate 3,4-dioxygenase beta subunit